MRLAYPTLGYDIGWILFKPSVRAFRLIICGYGIVE